MNTPTATLSFWLTDEPSDQIPTAETLLVDAHHYFRERFLGQNRRYAVFLNDFFDSHSSYFINRGKLAWATNRLISVYSRVYDLLSHYEKRIIAIFSRTGSFDNEAARVVLDEFECRGRVPRLPLDTPVPYDGLADVANAFGVFAPEVSGADLERAKNGDHPLTAPNIARAVFFLSLMQAFGWLPRDWKKQMIGHGTLRKADGSVPSLHYLQSKTSEYAVDTFLAIEHGPRGWRERLSAAFKALAESV